MHNPVLNVFQSLTDVYTKVLSWSAFDQAHVGATWTREINKWKHVNTACSAQKRKSGESHSAAHVHQTLLVSASMPKQSERGKGLTASLSLSGLGTCKGHNIGTVKCHLNQKSIRHHHSIIQGRRTCPWCWNYSCRPHQWYAIAYSKHVDDFCCQGPLLCYK